MPGRIRFSNPAGEGLTLGPYRQLRFEGERLYAHPERTLVAEHVGHHWSTPDGSFSRLDYFDEAITVYFERGGERSRPLGQFSHFSCINGVAYADRRIVAACDTRSADWYSYDVGSHWPTMVVALL
jgi:hypothetical protein